MPTPCRLQIRRVLNIHCLAASNFKHQVINFQLTISHYIEWTNDTKKADVSSGNLVDGVTQFWPIWVPDTTWSCQNQTWSSWSYIKNSFTSTLTLQRNTIYNTFLEFFSSVCSGKVNRNWNMDQISHCIIFQKCYVYHNSSTSRLKKYISLH